MIARTLTFEMNEALSLIGAVVAAAVGLGGLWIRHREIADGESRRILRDMEILRSLTEPSAARAVLQAAIDDCIVTMLKNRSSKRRNGMNIGIGLFFLAATLGLVLLASRGGWWWLVSPLILFTAIFGAYGTIEGSINAERDARGNIVTAKGRERKAEVRENA